MDMNSSSRILMNSRRLFFLNTIDTKMCIVLSDRYFRPYSVEYVWISEIKEGTSKNDLLSSSVPSGERGSLDFSQEKD